MTLHSAMQLQLEASCCAYASGQPCLRDWECMLTCTVMLVCSLQLLAPVITSHSTTQLQLWGIDALELPLHPQVRLTACKSSPACKIERLCSALPAS